MGLGRRIIIVFIIGVIAVNLLGLKGPVHDFFDAILLIPEPAHVRNPEMYHLGKICIFLIAFVAIVKLLRNTGSE